MSPLRPPALDVFLQGIIQGPAEFSIPLIKLLDVQARQDQFALPGFETPPDPSEPFEFFVFEMFAQYCHSSNQIVQPVRV